MIEKDEVKNIAETVSYLLSHREEYSDEINRLKHEHFYNLGTSGEVGAEYIIKRLTKKKKKKKPAEIVSENAEAKEADWYDNPSIKQLEEFSKNRQ